MLRARIGLALGLLLWALPATAGTITLLAEGAECDGLHCSKINHNNVGASGQGDSHWDVVLDEDYTNDPLELTYFHFGYPGSSTDSIYTMGFNVETDETDTSKQICLRASACAAVSGDAWYDCSLSSGAIDTVFQVPASGASFTRRWTTVSAGAATIRRTSTNGACDLATCNSTRVRLAVRKLNTVSGCTNPSTATVRISAAYIYYQ